MNKNLEDKIYLIVVSGFIFFLFGWCSNSFYNKDNLFNKSNCLMFIDEVELQILADIELASSTKKNIGRIVYKDINDGQWKINLPFDSCRKILKWPLR